jgi:hypothetical protein
MVTNENYNFCIYSIMLTTEKMKKKKTKVFQEKRFWTFIFCPF